MFTTIPSYDRYRTLKLTKPATRGEDVYSLQTALLACGFDPKGADGVFGNNTLSAVRAAQARFRLVVDGLAGQKTQRALGLFLADDAETGYDLAAGLMEGQLEHESSWLLGNYSAIRANGSYDAGVAQRNTEFTPAVEGFDAAKSITALAAHTRKFYNKFAPVKNDRRRWELAAGAWNAPYYASYLAGVKPWAVPGPTARAKLETYITDVCKYLA